MIVATYLSAPHDLFYTLRGNCYISRYVHHEVNSDRSLVRWTQWVIMRLILGFGAVVWIRFEVLLPANFTRTSILPRDIADGEADEEVEMEMEIDDGTPIADYLSADDDWSRANFKTPESLAGNEYEENYL